MNEFTEAIALTLIKEKSTIKPNDTKFVLSTELETHRNILSSEHIFKVSWRDINHAIENFCLELLLNIICKEVVHGRGDEFLSDNLITEYTVESSLFESENLKEFFLKNPDLFYDIEQVCCDIHGEIPINHDDYVNRLYYLLSYHEVSFDNFNIASECQDSMADLTKSVVYWYFFDQVLDLFRKLIV